MRIFVNGLLGGSTQLDASPHDTVADLKQKVQDAIGVSVDDQNLLYSGKQMTDERTLSYYQINECATIHMTSRVGTARTTSGDRHFKSHAVDSDNDTTPDEAPFSSGQHQTQPSRPRKSPKTTTRSSLKSLNGWDDDEHLLNPVIYYERLDILEMTVFQNSEYYRSGGQYHQNSMKDADAMYKSAHCCLEVWRCFDRYFARKPPPEREIASESAMNLGETYLILCKILDILEDLKIDFFTVLIIRSEGVAELVGLTRDVVANLQDAIEDSILGTFWGGKPVTVRQNPETLAQKLVPALQVFMESLGIASPELLSSCDLINLSRSLTLILDLGLVSYMGSHGTRFDQEYMGDEQSEMLFDNGKSIGFGFSLVRLACLDEFLNSRKVWAFRPLWTVERKRPETPLSVLTTFKALAETWGPIWQVTAGYNYQEYFKEISIGAGRISRAESGVPCSIEGAVACHWSRTGSTLHHLFAEGLEDLLIPKNQKMLIGGIARLGLEKSQKCTYTLDSLESDYGLYMTPLGTMPSSWAYDERQIGFSASQYVGITVMGTQKKLPCVTQKQAIWNKWTNQPSRANPRILNSYLGVEISHCSGNARRVKLRDIFAMRQVQALLDRQFPGWKSTEFGPSLQLALHSSWDQAIEDVWLKHHKTRGQMAELVCCVLDLLEKTGLSSAGFNATFLNQQKELSMPIQPRLNRWVEFLEDSHLTAVYAIVNDCCLTRHEREPIVHRIATCTSMKSDGFTILETQLTVPHSDSRDKIWLNQRGFLQQVAKTKEGIQLVTWESGKTRELGNKLSGLLRSKRSPVLSRELQDAGELGGEHVQVLVKSTVPSFGGLPDKRSLRNEIQAQSIFRDSRHSLESDSHLDQEDALVMLRVGGEPCFATI